MRINAPLWQRRRLSVSPGDRRRPTRGQLESLAQAAGLATGNQLEPATTINTGTA